MSVLKIILTHTHTHTHSLLKCAEDNPRTHANTASTSILGALKRLAKTTPTTSGTGGRYGTGPMSVCVIIILR